MPEFDAASYEKTIQPDRIAEGIDFNPTVDNFVLCDQVVLHSAAFLRMAGMVLVMFDISLRVIGSESISEIDMTLPPIEADFEDDLQIALVNGFSFIASYPGEQKVKLSLSTITDGVTHNIIASFVYRAAAA